MRKRIINFNKLVVDNKKEIIKDLDQVDKIEKKLEEKHFKRIRLS